MASICASHAAQERFEETAWSVVIATGATTPARAHTAMAELCRIYWRPIYAYLRRSGYDTHDAQDLTQSFFQHLLENETLRRVSREKGRFRSFLLGALKLCLADEQARRHTLKRGGRIQFISTDELEIEELLTCTRIVKLHRMKFLTLVGQAWCWNAHSRRFAQNVLRMERRKYLKRSTLFSQELSRISVIKRWRIG